ncbi:MAG: rod shape-determining protein MreC [Bacteroidaceae bacterium]|nr:rod shape-determining protein MreC [Bacteroidaceae bacterium]
MRNLLLFIQKYNYWFLFFLLEIVSFVLIFQFNSYQGSVYFTSANEVSGRIYEIKSKITTYFGLVRLNKELTEQNVQLNLELDALRQQLSESKDTLTVSPYIRPFLDTVATVPAVVINATTNRLNNFMTIDKGESDGVHADMGVVSGSGLVGVVYQTTAHYALVLPVINQMSTISCRIRGRTYLGNLRWDGTDCQYAMLEDVPRHAYFKKGDLVETSGYSSTFPAGIVAGKIVAIYDSNDGMSYELKVQLSTDFGRIRDVMILPLQAAPELNVLQDRVNKLEEKRK